MSSTISWVLKKFSDLSVYELYAILQLRNEVFVVEQTCVYQDTDGKDPECWHLMGWQNERLTAYARLLPPGFVYQLPSIGRVVTSPAVRKSGVGRQLMKKSIEATENLFGKTAVRVGAQLYLKKFYESLGFRQTSDIYLEDGIEHIEMIKP